MRVTAPQPAIRTQTYLSNPVVPTGTRRTRRFRRETSRPPCWFPVYRARRLWSRTPPEGARGLPLGVADGSLHRAIRLALGDGGALVVGTLAARQADQHLR